MASLADEGDPSSRETGSRRPSTSSTAPAPVRSACTRPPVAPAARSSPAGIVADSFVLNQEWGQAVSSQGVPCATAEQAIAHMTEIKARIHPDLGNIANETHKLVADGRLTVPIAEVWSHGDPWGCGANPMVCPLRDGTTRRARRHRLDSTDPSDE